MSRPAWAQMLLAFVVVVSGAITTVADPAGAHTDLVQGSPGPGQRIGGEVDFIDLVYAAPVTEVEVTVRRPDGTIVDGEMVNRDGQIIRYRMEPITEPGRYLVGYEMISDDGDFTIGRYFFDYDEASVAPIRLGQFDVPDDTVFSVRNMVGAVAVVVLGGICLVQVNRIRRSRAELEARRTEAAR